MVKLSPLGKASYGTVAIIDLRQDDPKYSGKDPSDGSKHKKDANGLNGANGVYGVYGDHGVHDDAYASGMARPSRDLEAPNGGWGWMVVFGAAVCNATAQSLLSVYGLLFGGFLEAMGETTTGAAIVSNTMVSITSFSGLITGPMMRRFTYRQIAMAGGLLVSTGLLFTSIATKMWHLIITYSILVGLGLGLLTPSIFVAVNAYFTTARGRAVGLSLAGTGVGQMLMPLAVRFLLDQYSFHGAVLILSAVSLHCLAGAMLFHPLHWHARRAPREPSASGSRQANDEDETQGERLPLAPRRASPRHLFQRRPLSSDSSSSGSGGGGGGSSEGDGDDGRRAQGIDSESQLLTSGAKKIAPSSLQTTPQESAIMEDHISTAGSKGSHASVKDNEPLEAFSERDYVAQANGGGDGRCRGCWAHVVRVMDLDLLKDPSMALLQAGLAAVYAAGVNFNMLYPFFLAHSGLPRGDVALCMSVMAGLDIAGRLLLPMVTDRLHVPARITFLLGALVLAAMRSLVALQETFPALIAASSLCGFVRSATTVNLNLAISDSCSPEKLPGALGINMVIKGISIIVLGLFIGWLRDITGSFQLCMHILSLIVVVPMLVWTAEIWVQRRRRRRLPHPHPVPSSSTQTSPHPPPPPPPPPPTYDSPMPPSLPSPPSTPSPRRFPSTSATEEVIKAAASPRLQGQR